MKKIKYIAPILGAIASAGAIAPILTSCNNSNVNKVVLQKNQVAERTVTANSATLAFYLKQENTKNPEDTKVSIKDFAINGVTGLKAPDKTIKFVADAAGNMRVTVDVKSIIASWSSVETIEITLTFTNKTAGTQHDFGPLKINIVESGSEEAEDTPGGLDINVPGEEPGEIIAVSSWYSTFDNDVCKYNIVVTQPNHYLPENITVKDGSGNDLAEGSDYVYYIDPSNHTRGAIWAPNYGADNPLNVTIDLSSTAITVRDTVPIKNSTNTNWADGVLTITDPDGKCQNALDGITTTEEHFVVNSIIFNNSGESDKKNVVSQNEDLSMKNAIDKIDELISNFYYRKDIEQSKSLILVKYNVSGTDTESKPVTFTGSFAIKVNKNVEKLAK